MHERTPMPAHPSTAQLAAARNCAVRLSSSACAGGCDPLQAPAQRNPAPHLVAQLGQGAAARQDFPHNGKGHAQHGSAAHKQLLRAVRVGGQHC